MTYLKKFKLLNEEQEGFAIIGERRTYIYNSYPFRLFPDKGLEKLDFGDITILYGGNGSGKSTLLNIIASKIKASGAYPQGEFFQKYVNMCQCEMSIEHPRDIKIIKSDDIFDYLYNVKRINYGGYNERGILAKEYLENKYLTINNMDDYQKMKASIDAKKKTMSSYVRSRMLDKDIPAQSNGESALQYFVTEIKEDAIYLLDEPENSMSASMQLKLVKFLEESVRFFNCQFIIATHSPFILGMKNALIYNLDSTPVKTEDFGSLENMQVYYNFFKENKDKFE